MGWLIFGGYMLGWVLTARWIQPRMTDMMVIGNNVDTFDKIMSSAASFLVGCLWPIVAVGALTFYKNPKSTTEIKAERNEFERRTRELERENDRLRREQEGG